MTLRPSWLQWRHLETLRLRLEVALWRHGWLWIAAPGLALVALALWLGVLVPLQGVTLRAESELVRLQAQQLRWRDGAKAQVAAPVVENDEERLKAVLLPRASASALVRVIYDIAAREQLPLTQAEFHEDVGQGVVRLQMTLPTRAPYLAVRRFIESTLLGLPNVSVDKLAVQRQKVSEGEPEVRIHLSLWLLEDDAPAGGLAAAGIAAARSMQP